MKKPRITVPTEEENLLELNNLNTEDPEEGFLDAIDEDILDL